MKNKKREMCLLLIILLISIVNILPIKAPKNILSFFDLFFLNYDNFEIYHLQKFNIQYLICFFLYNNVVLYFILMDILETHSFFLLLMYRIGKMKTYIHLLSKNIIDIVGFLLCTFLSLIILNLIYSNFNINIVKIWDIVCCLIYLLKYYLYIFIFTLLYNFLSIIGKNLNGLMSINILFIGLILIDLLFNIHLITFSANFFYEINIVIVLTILSFSLVILFINILKRRGEIL